MPELETRRPPNGVLVVEDDPDQGAMLADLIGLVSDSVAVATSAEEALMLHMRSAFRVVVADVNLEGMTGIELLRTLSDGAEVDGEAAPRVVLLTGSARLDGSLDALRLGAVQYLEKPYDPDRLLRTLRELLSEDAVASAPRA